VFTVFFDITFLAVNDSDVRLLEKNARPCLRSG